MQLSVGEDLSLWEEIRGRENWVKWTPALPIGYQWNLTLDCTRVQRHRYLTDARSRLIHLLKRLLFQDTTSTHTCLANLAVRHFVNGKN